MLDIRTLVRVYSGVVRVGEVAERAGVNVETLRYYERRGLLAEPARTPHGHRRYDEETVRFVRAIKEAQALGFTLAEIEEYLRVSVRGMSAASEALRVRMASKIDEIDGRIAGLRRVRADLARVVGCACESLDHCTCGAAYLARGGRDPESHMSTLHVTNGESAGNTLRQTSIGGAVLPWQDALHEGPVPDVARAELRATRAAFLSACGWGSLDALLGQFERRDRHLLSALHDGRPVVLWFEHDLYDQLQLLDVLSLVAEREADTGRLELIVVGSFPGRTAFHGLGELTAEELETLWSSRIPANPGLFETATAAWDAVRAPHPTALAELALTERRDMPFVAAALRRLLEELPAAGNGLSRTERGALVAVRDGAQTPMEAFLALQRAEEAPFLGDAWFYRALVALGRGKPRLLETIGGEPLPDAPPLGDARDFAHAGLRLTEHGERVLAGEEDRVALLGIDRWVGGTHVVRDAVWRWDANSSTVSLDDGPA